MSGTVEIDGVVIEGGNKVYTWPSALSRKRSRFIAYFMELIWDPRRKRVRAFLRKRDGTPIYRDLDRIQPIKGRPKKEKRRRRHF